MDYNIIPVSFYGRQKAYAPEINYIYDQQQFLMLQDLENLPAYFRVDFCNEGDELTKPVIGTADSIWIPDEFLLTGKAIRAYIVLDGPGEAVQTRYEIDIQVRFRPPSTEEVPTPEEWSVIDQLIAALNAGVEAAAGSASEAGGYAQDAHDDAQAIQNMGAIAISISPELEAYVEKTVDPQTGVVTLHFGIPKGEKGDKGDRGDAASSTVRDDETGIVYQIIQDIQDGFLIETFEEVTE